MEEMDEYVFYFHAGCKCSEMKETVKLPKGSSLASIERKYQKWMHEFITTDWYKKED